MMQRVEVIPPAQAR